MPLDDDSDLRCKILSKFGDLMFQKCREQTRCFLVRTEDRENPTVDILTLSEGEQLDRYLRILRHNRGDCTPAEDLIDNLISRYVRCGNKLTPADVQDELEDYRHHHSRMVENAQRYAQLYPELVLEAGVNQAS